MLSVAALVGATALGATTNGAALLLLALRPALRTLANRFVINLLAGNLICAMVLAPLLVAEHTHWVAPGPVPCAVAEGSVAFFCLASVLAVFLIATDQYLAVTDPLRYHAKVSHGKSLLMIGTQWIASGIFGIAAALTPQPVASAWNFCQTNQPEAVIALNVYKIIFSCIYIGGVILSFVLICWMYSRISMAARRSAKPPAPQPLLTSLKIDSLNKNDNKSREECVSLLISCDKKSVSGESSEGAPPTIEIIPPYEPQLARSLRSVLLDVNTPYPSPLCLKLTHETEKKGLSHDDIYKISQNIPSSGLKTVRSSPNFGSVECEPIVPPPRSTSSYMTSLRCRISNASLFRYREESRAARISALVVVLALVSQLPAAVLQAAPFLGISPVVALFVGTCISPFLFAYRSRRVQKEIVGLCCKKSKNRMHGVAPLRRTSSLSTERSWRSTKINSSQTALKLLKTLSDERDTSVKSVPSFTGCPPGKSILKKVRAQSRRWGKRTRRCEFKAEAKNTNSPTLEIRITNEENSSDIR